MKPTKELIWALRRAVVRILDPAEGYQWANPDNCNCGIFVREVCGLTEKEFRKLRQESVCYGWSYWGEGKENKVAQVMCHQTDLPMSFVFETMAELGFEPEDYKKIKTCGLGAGSAAIAFNKFADELEQQLTGIVTTCDEPTAQPDRPFATRQTTTNQQPQTA